MPVRKLKRRDPIEEMCTQNFEDLWGFPMKCYRSTGGDAVPWVHLQRKKWDNTFNKNEKFSLHYMVSL